MRDRGRAVEEMSALPCLNDHESKRRVSTGRTRQHAAFAVWNLAEKEGESRMKPNPAKLAQQHLGHDMRTSALRSSLAAATAFESRMAIVASRFTATGKSFPSVPLNVSSGAKQHLRSKLGLTTQNRGEYQPSLVQSSNLALPASVSLEMAWQLSHCRCQIRVSLPTRRCAWNLRSNSAI